MSRKRKQKPLFKKKRSPEQVAVKAFVIIMLIAVALFVAISVGKPFVERFYPQKDTHQGNTPSSGSLDTPQQSDSSQAATSEPTTTPDSTSATTVTTQPPVIRQGVYYFSFPNGSDLNSNIEQLYNELLLASRENYLGFCVELISHGGKINFATQNKLANDAQAVRAEALTLGDIVSAIKEHDLLPYARISALSDNLASMRDRSICYLFEDGSSKWLDNKLSNGGKPWISPFTDSAKAYISSFVTEISDAGFAGIVAGELEFPPFRAKDLGYVGKSVQSPTRYTALCDFSNLLSDTLGSAKSYIIEVNAHDILAGECEILTQPKLLNTKTVYVKYDSVAIGSRIEKQDESIISFDGLSEDQKLLQVYRLVNTQLAQSGMRIIPAVESPLTVEEIYTALAEVGFKPDDILIY